MMCNIATMHTRHNRRRIFSQRAYFSRAQPDLSEACARCGRERDSFHIWHRLPPPQMLFFAAVPRRALHVRASCARSENRNRFTLYTHTQTRQLTSSALA
jgi:hypothetical protein